MSTDSPSIIRGGGGRSVAPRVAAQSRFDLPWLRAFLAAPAFGDFRKAIHAALAGLLITAAWEGFKLITLSRAASWRSHLIAVTYGAFLAFSLYLIFLRRERAASQRLRASMAFSEVLMEGLPGVVCIFDASGMPKRWNVNFLGYSAAEVMERGVLVIVAPESLDAVRTALKNSLEKGADETEAWLIARNGARIPTYLKGVRILFENEPCVLGMALDISKQRRWEEVSRLTELANRELREANDTIRRLARTDALTSLANRRTLDEGLLREAARAERLGQGLSMILGDLDHFKTINDEFGHLVGDQVLIATAKVFASQSRPYDLAARFGGEEFILVLSASPIEVAAAVAERIRQRVADLKIAGCPTQITVSVGVASWKTGESLERFFARADAALYEAKRAGRNRVALNQTSGI